MQASKMKIGELYAIQRGNTVTAFKVTSIDTQRTSRGTSSTIRGQVYDVVTNQTIGAEVAYEVMDFAGPYEATKAETDAKAARDAQRKADAKRSEERAVAVLEAVAAHFGAPKPKRHKEYGSWHYSHDLPFRLDYNNKIEVTKAGMEILAEFFKIDQQQQEDNQDGATVINMK